MGSPSTGGEERIETMKARVQSLEAELACARAALTVESSRVLADGSEVTFGSHQNSDFVTSLSGFASRKPDDEHEESLPGIMLMPLQRFDALRRKWKLGQGLPISADCGSPCAGGGNEAAVSGRLRLLGLLEDGRPWEYGVTFRELAREGGITLGRAPEECDAVLLDESVSRVHARLELASQGVVISDIHSTNGLMVNDVEVTAYAPQLSLTHGSVLRIGEVPLRVEFLHVN